jgi:Flp pilus assembly protein TadB
VDDPARYKASWEDRRTRFLVLLAMIFVFFVALLAWPSPLVLAVCFAAAMATAWRFATFRCPRCDEHFMGMPEDDFRFWRRDTCQSCSLPVDSPPG